MATRAEVKNTIDTHINTEAVLGHKIHPVSDHQVALKLVVDNAVFKDDDASSLLTASNLATMLDTQLTGAGGISVTKSGNTITITQVDTNTQIDAQGLVDLINNSDGNVDAAISSDNTKIKLTATTSGGGGGSVDATALLGLIDNTAGNVDAATSENDNTKIKLTAPTSGGTTSVGDGIEYRAINSSDISGNTTAITTAWLDKRNTFRGTSLSANHTVTMESSVGANNNIIQITNEDADNTITVSGDISGAPNNSNPVLAKFDWVKFQKTSTSWKIIERGSLLPSSSGGTPTPESHEMMYAGVQNSNSFASWAVGDAESSYDVQTSGATVTVDIGNVPLQHYLYMLFPTNRSPTSIISSLGSESISDFTVNANPGVTVGGQAYEAYTLQNTGVRAIPTTRLIVTVE